MFSVLLIGLDRPTVEVFQATVQSADLEVRACDKLPSPLGHASDLGTDCVVVDVAQPARLGRPPYGLDVLGALAAGGGPPALGVARCVTAWHVSRAIDLGAVAVLDLPADPASLRAAVGQAMKAGAERRAERARRQDAVDRVASLTPDQRDVLAMLLEGFSNKQIAIRLRIGLRTVERHRAESLVRLKATSLVDAALLLAWLAGRTELSAVQAALRRPRHRAAG